jgi:hypothetical protein
MGGKKKTDSKGKGGNAKSEGENAQGKKGGGKLKGGQAITARHILVSFHRANCLSTYTRNLDAFC